MNLEGLTINILKNFLTKKLLGGRIDKVFQPQKHTLVLQIRSGRENLFLYVNVSANLPHLRLLSKNTANPESPSGFCMLLRKHLENGRITQISQENLDRVITFDIDTMGIGSNIVTKKLVVELTGKNSNLILVQNDIIVDCIKHIGANFNKFRQMLPQRPYLSPPPKNAFNILTTASKLISHNLPKPALLGPALVQTASGIGPFTAQEIAFRAGFSPDFATENLDAEDLQSLAEALESITAPIKNNEAELTVSKSQQGKLLALTPYLPQHLAKLDCLNFPDINAALEYAANFQQALPAENIGLLKFVQNETFRLEKKISLLKEEYHAATQAEAYKNIADNLMANLPHLEKGISEFTYQDYTTNESRKVTLQAHLNPMENVQNYYKLYNKAKRGVDLIKAQIEASEGLAEYLTTIEISLQNSQSKEELGEIKEELKNLGLLKTKSSKNMKVQASQPLKISLPSGSLIYIGKNNKQNDLVTFKIARSHDLWFHTKDIPGSHVILQSIHQEQQPEELELAASMAGWFSKAKNSANIPVDYTLRKNVKKPAGSKPGFVIYEKQKTIYLTPDEKKINSLLE